MAVLPQLLDPEHYRPCTWDLKRDEPGRRYWVRLFREHLTYLLERIEADYPDAEAGRREAFRREYLETLAAFQDEPARFERMDILRLTELRRDLQRRHGFPDPFRSIKDRENELALELLPGVLAELDEHPDDAQPALLAAGLMAGNVFDLGSPAAVERYHAGEMTFETLRQEQQGRPWLVNDLPEWRRQWDSGGYRHVLFFVDNAGADIWLGCLPLVRWMLRQGARVTLAANTAPTLNDVTADELAARLPRAAAGDETLSAAWAERRLRVVPSGGELPLLDLRDLSEACVSAAADADLLILHGMGRSVESNAEARFRCDALRSAVLKDPAIAERVGGRLFDALFRFEAAD